MNAAKQAQVKKAVETRARRREELAERMRYFQRRAEDEHGRASCLETALAFALPILERVAEGGSWSLEGQGGDAARDAVRMAKKALEPTS